MISLHILQAQYTASVSDQSLVASMCHYYTNLIPTNMLPIFYTIHWKVHTCFSSTLKPGAFFQYYVLSIVLNYIKLD